MAKVMDDIDFFLAMVNGEIEEPKTEFVSQEHGRIVKTRFDPYHDVTVFEDWYEERYYIGD